MKLKNIATLPASSNPVAGASFGRFEAFQYGLALLPIMFTALSYGNFVFAAGPTYYRCLVPECESNPPQLDVDWWPPGVADARCLKPRLTTSSGQNCSVDMFTNETDTCDAWVYEDDNTIVSEFGLACQEWKRTMVGTVHNIGVFFAMPLIGFAADRWGRRTAIIISSSSLVTGALKTLVGGPSAFITYLVIEFIEALLVSGTYTAAFILMLELVGTDKRTISSFALGVSITLGELLLALIVWLVPYWRHFQLIIYLPGIIFLSYIFLLEESYRWLITNGKMEKALTLLKKSAKWNNQQVPNKIEVEEEKSQVIEQFSLKLLFSSPMLLKRLLVCSWWWFSTAFVYYGLIINSVYLPGNKITNFALSAFATFPGDLTALFALEKFGRKVTLMSGFLFCAVCCFANGFITNEQKVLKIVVFFLGKSSISVCFNAIYIYTSELMPTSARSSLVGTCSMLARLGSVLAPLTPLLSEVWSSLPTMVFGCAALCAGALTLYAPETRHRELPDTVAQAAAFTDKV